MFYKKCSWPNRVWGILPLPVILLLVVTADSAKAHIRFPFLKDFQPPEKTGSEYPTKVEETSTFELPNLRLGSPDTFYDEPVIRETVVDVQLLPRELPGLETTAEALQGLDLNKELNQDSIWQYPAMNLQEMQWEVLDIQAAAEELRGTDSEAFDIDDYIPEPTGQPLINVDMDVATVPDERVQWRATLWSGVMTDNDLGETLTAQEVVLRDSGFLGVGLSRTLAGGNSIKLEGELQLLNHVGQQDHLEGTAALGLRWEMSPRFSVAAIQGVSYATALPEIEDENNARKSQFLNYLAFEVEYLYRSGWAIAGRLHHRSGAGGIYGNAVGGSNAYLFGLRHRF
jgi:hypothetical protein